MHLELMLFVLIPFSIILLLTIYFFRYIGEDEKQYKHYFAIILLILWFQTLFISASIGQLKMTPHHSLETNMTQITDKLLKCASRKIPSLTKSWHLLRDCAHNIQVHHIPKSKIPLVKLIPVAFVAPQFFSKDVFLVNSEYDVLSITSKALTVIHECTHLVLQTVDHAYLWQPNFKVLSSKKQLENADSYVDIILNNCINDIYVF